MTEQRRDLWVGTYPVAGAGSPVGQGEGIWRIGLDLTTGTLTEPRRVVATPAPSFLALDRAAGVLYAVGEDSHGTISAFRITEDSLVPLGTADSGGADPCHLLVDPDGRALYVANYSSGTVAVFRIGADGLTGTAPDQIFGHAGSGPVADRQEGPHAHFVALAPGGEHLLVSDLGTDQLRRYRRDTDTGLLADDGIAATFAPGSGPRHLVFSADGSIAYVACELDDTVTVLAWDRATATGTVVQHVPAQESGSTEVDSFPSHIDRAGDRVLVATRGPDRLATFAAGPDGQLAPAGQADLPGDWPRHFALVEGLVVVADQTSDTLTVLRDGATTDRVSLPAPACVVIA
ncbi:lactonase family protein [Cellulomonas sp. NPDC089187]|uniref:lactonase family protein n=1 Tax=Cellulomonas sp. NPDC089187 TaxID=3154970 RepID=UPI00343FB930